MKNHVKKAAILLLWLLIWTIAARWLNKPLVLAGPEQVAGALVRLLPAAAFRRTIAGSFIRIGAGFLGGMATGLLLGAAAYAYSFLEELIRPVISLMKAVPVASFVILALMAMGSKNLAVLIVWIMVTPIIYHNTLKGLQSTDRELLEVAQVFQMSTPHKIRAIYIPAVRPFMISAAQTGIGMSWKSGVAAEVIGVSAGSIGEQLYMSKIYLETADVFAWTIVIILLSAATEKGMTFLLQKLMNAS